MEKRGISDVVTTILFILLAIGAVLIVWGLVRTQLSSSESQITGFRTCLDLDLEVSRCTSTAADIKVIVKRGSGSSEVNLKELALIIESAEGDIKTIMNSTFPGVLETKSYTLTVANIGFTPKYVNVAGKIEIEPGNDKLCDPVATKVECKSA